MVKSKKVGARSEVGPTPVAEEVTSESIKEETPPEFGKENVPDPVEGATEGTPIRDEWLELELIEIRDCDSLKSGDVTIRRDRQRHGYDTHIYKKLRTQNEGTGFCVLIYGKK